MTAQSRDGADERTYRAEVGARLRHQRAERRWTQARLGQPAGVPGQLVSAYELGRIPVDPAVLAALAAALGVPVGDLVEGRTR